MHRWTMRLALLICAAALLAGCGSSSSRHATRPQITPPPSPCSVVPAPMGCAVRQHFGLNLGAGFVRSSSGAQGLDISNFQGFPDLARAKAAGLRFLIGQSNDGSNFRDFNFVTNWIRARQLGIPHGAYVFARPGCASCQAALLAAQVRRAGGMDANALPPTIDAEVPGAYCNVGPIAFWLRRDLNISRVLTYTSPGLWGCGSSNGGTLLWAAIWGERGFPFAGWSSFYLQQYCGLHCHFPGVSGEVDRDVDHGVLSLLAPPETPAQHHARVRHERQARLLRDYRARRGLRSVIRRYNCSHGYRGFSHDHRRKCTVWRVKGAAVNHDIKRLHALGIR